MQSFPFTRLILVAALTMPVFANAAQRTFVSTSGNDANAASNCSSTAPCRGFAAALTVTDAGGEIIVLGSGGYGPVAINKSASIIAPEGVYAGISVFSGNGVTVSGAGVEVTLRGLNINGLGGVNGIAMSSGASLTVERCTVSNMSEDGLLVAAAAKVRVRDSIFADNGQQGATIGGAAKALVTGSQFYRNTSVGLLAQASGVGQETAVEVSDSHAHSNGAAGFQAQGMSSGSARLDLINSTSTVNASSGAVAFASGGSARTSVTGALLAGNAYAGVLSTGAGATLVASGNAITRNTTGLVQSASGVLETDGSNVVRENPTATAGSITSFAKI